MGYSCAIAAHRTQQAAMIRLVTRTLIPILLLGVISACGPSGSPGGQDAPEAPEAADRHKDFGDYIVHFNAFTTDQLRPEESRAYGIQRSKSRALLNVVILKKIAGQPDRPMSGDVSAKTTNLTGQLKNLSLRPLRDGEAIYYVGDLPVSNSETLVFEISATPEGETEPLEWTFRQQFFTD